jgi:hypothetical protein
MSQRHEFSAATKREAYERSGGICECHRIPNWPHPICRAPLGQGNTFYEHIDPDAICGRNDLDNAAVLTKTCWHLKTNTIDKPVIAKANRVRDRARGIKPENYPPIIGSRRSGWKHHMNGGWMRR